MGKTSEEIILKSGKIFVTNLETFAFHGVHPLEQKTGHWFWVNLSVETDFSGAVAGDLTRSIDYTLLAEIARKQMNQPRKLLETVVHAIAQDVLKNFPQVETVFVEIKKQTPPVKGVESVGVSGTFSRT